MRRLTVDNLILYFRRQVELGQRHIDERYQRRHAEAARALRAGEGGMTSSIRLPIPISKQSDGPNRDLLLSIPVHRPMRPDLQEVSLTIDMAIAQEIPTEKRGWLEVILRKLGIRRVVSVPPLHRVVLAWSSSDGTVGTLTIDGVLVRQFALDFPMQVPHE